jgi:hypothetical protein
VKTTIEIPDSTFRRAKSFAAAKGISLKQLFTEAMDEKLRQIDKRCKTEQPPWMKGFGGLADLKAENTRIMALVEEEFEKLSRRTGSDPGYQCPLGMGGWHCGPSAGPEFGDASGNSRGWSSPSIFTAYFNRATDNAINNG